jgi:hypothetical protein
MGNKGLIIKEEDLKDLVPHMGFSIASNAITIDGEKIGFMYREHPDSNEDSGWRFLSGNESQEYIDDEENSKIMAVNTMANYDPAIIPYLKLSVGTEMERVEGTDEFRDVLE